MNILQLFRRKSKSSTVAKHRLRLVIQQDRFDVDEQVAGKLHRELVAVLAKYFDFSMNSVQMSLKRDGNSYILSADFPYKKVMKPPY